MKKRNLFLVLLIAVCSTTFSISCKNKNKEATTEQKKTDDNTKPVEISSDVTLRSSVNDVVKAYNGVEADVKDGVVTLRGSLTKSELHKLVMKVNELKPKKVETDKIVIKS